MHGYMLDRMYRLAMSVADTPELMNLESGLNIILVR